MYVFSRIQRNKYYMSANYGTAKEKYQSYILEISINLNIDTNGRLEGVYEVKVEIMPCRYIGEVQV